MKVVDEKGKLFGKLNIIDLLVIIFIIAAVVVVGVKFLGGRIAGDGDLSGAEDAKLTYTVRIPALRPELAAQLGEHIDITTGRRDQLVSNTDLVENAYVVDFWTEPAQYNILNDGSVEFYDVEEGENQGLVDLCFVIEAQVEDTRTNIVGVQEVRVGRNYVLKTSHIEFTGTIEKCTWNPVE